MKIILYEQAVAQRFRHHQACLTRAPERSTKGRKERPVTATPITYQMVKTHRRFCLGISWSVGRKLHQLIGKTISQHQNGRIKFTRNNINLQCKWAKCLNQKKQTGKLDKRSKPISVLYPGNPSHMQGHTEAQNKEMEEDLPSKWRAKKNQELQS